MRAGANLLIKAIGVFFAAWGAVGCAATVSPGARPELDDETGIVVLVIDTDTPLYGIVFNRADDFEGFKLEYVDRGRSVHLFKVPADRYRLSSFDAGQGAFALDGGAQLCVLVKPGQMNYPGHFVYRGPEKKKGLETYAHWQWKADVEDMKRRVTVEWTDLLAAYPVQTTACP